LTKETTNEPQRRGQTPFWRKLTWGIAALLLAATGALGTIRLEHQALSADKSTADAAPAPVEKTAEKKRNYSEIEDGLFLGGHVDEPPPGTKAVLNLCGDKDSFKCDVEAWHFIPDAAPAPSLDWLREQVQFVDKERRAGHPVYVHCWAGISRSAMVTTAYLMQENHWTRDEALKFVRSKRSVVSPNSAFMELLQKWEKTTKG
jgi:hypothetical protein